MANPYEKYAKPADNPYRKFDQTKEKSMLTEIGESAMEGLPGRFGVRTAQGAMGLPGMPIDAMVAGGNFLRRQFDAPEVPVVPGTPAYDWGSPGWREFFEKYVGKANIPDATTEAERITDKAGSFVGGSLPFGPAAIVPALTATAGSEVGRATDQAGLTGGYGEFGGAIVGGMAPGLVRGQTTAGITGRAPTNEQLRQTADAAYKQADNAGVIVNPNGVGQLATEAKQVAADFAFDPALQPGIKVILDRLDEAAQGNVTLKGVDTIRKMAGNVARDGANPSQRELASRLIEKIDDFVDNLSPSSVISGNPQTAAASLKVARDAWRRLRKSEMVDEALTKAERRAASTGSGGNADNATRQNIRAILDNQKKARLFSQAERQLMERVVRGSTSQNALRLVGKLSPEGSGLMAALGIGATAANPVMSTFPAAGFVAKQGADALTKRNVTRLSEAVRQGGATSRATANELLLELQRRAKLAGKSTLPVLPGSVAPTR